MSTDVQRVAEAGRILIAKSGCLMFRSVTMAIDVLGAYYPTNGRLGLFVTDGTKVLMFGIETSDSKVVIESHTVISGAVTMVNVYNRVVPYLPPVMWFRITNDGTHRTYYFSLNGVSWNLVYQEAFNQFLVETSAGFGASDNGNGMALAPAMNIFSWSGA